MKVSCHCSDGYSGENCNYRTDLIEKISIFLIHIYFERGKIISSFNTYSKFLTLWVYAT
jgi:hypothetical protein